MVADLLVNRMELVMFQSALQHGFAFVAGTDCAVRHKIRVSPDLAPGGTAIAQDFCRQSMRATECATGTALVEVPAGCR